MTSIMAKLLLCDAIIVSPEAAVMPRAGELLSPARGIPSYNLIATDVVQIGFVIPRRSRVCVPGHIPLGRPPARIVGDGRGGTANDRVGHLDPRCRGAGE